MNFWNPLRAFSLFFVVTAIFASGFAFGAGSECLISQGLSESQQFQLTQNLFKDQLYRNAWDSAACSLADFPQSKHRIPLKLLQAQSAEQTQSSHHAQALQIYQSLVKEPLSFAQKAQVLLAIGRLQVQLEQFDSAITSLRSFLKASTQSSHVAEAHYWLGVAHFYRSELIRKEKGLSLAQAGYRLSESHFSQSKAPNLKQKQELYYLRGWIAHFQGRFQEAHEQYWMPYLDLKPDAEHASRVASQMGRNYHQTKDYFKAYIHFSKVLEWQNKGTFYSDALFWKAEDHYLHEASLSKNRDLKVSILKTLISEYEASLALKNSPYHALTLYRLGLLEQQAPHRKRAILRFQAYLKTAKPEYAGDSYVRLGTLYEQEGKNKEAIAALEKAQIFKEIRSSSSVRQQLSQLLEQEHLSEKNEALLNRSKNDVTLDAAGRKFFYLKTVALYFNQQKCPRVLKELKKRPESLSSKEIDSLQYMKGGCLLQSEQWKEARSVLAPLREDSEYGKQVVPLLLLAHQNLKDWKALDSEFEASHQRESPVLSSKDYALWVYALQQQKQWKSLNKVYSLWAKNFPQDVESVIPLGHWGEVLEHLSQTQKASAQYQKAVSLMDAATSLQIREGIIVRLGAIYQKQEKYEELVVLYEQNLMPYLLHKEAQQKYAFTLGNLYAFQLKQNKSAKKWYQQVDQGGTQDLELESILLLAQMDLDQKHPQFALPLLKNLQKRPLDDSWKMRLQSLLGSTYWQQESWKKSLKSFEFVVHQKPVQKEFYLKLQKTAQSRILWIRQHLAQTQLNTLVLQKKWKQVSWHIRTKLAQKEMPLDEYVFAQLRQAERTQKHWKKLLSAYVLLEKHSAERATTPEALLDRGEAAKNLTRGKEARKWLNQIDTTQNTDVAIRAVFLISEIDVQENKKQAALSRLEGLKKHKFSKRSKWYLPLHSQLGFLYASEKKLEQARRHYIRVLQTPQKIIDPAQKKQAKASLKDIEMALAYRALQEAVQQKKWALVSKQVQQGWKKGTLKKEAGVVEAWLQAEQQQQRWDRVWVAYALYNRVSPKQSQSISSLLNQGFAAEQLKKTKEAQKLYEKAFVALKNSPQSENESTRWMLMSRLGGLYEQEKLDTQQAKLYETHYPFFKTPQYQRKTALFLATLYLERLNQSGKAKKWLQKSDQGGTSDEEISAILMQAGRDIQAKDHRKAIERLDQLYRRKVPTSSPLYLRLHHTLGKLYQNSNQWKHAYRHYSFAAQAPVISTPDKALQKKSKDAVTQMMHLQKQEQFNELFQQKKWKALKVFIYKEVRKKNLLLTPLVSNALLQAERESKNPQGILKAYRLIEKQKPKQAQKLEALMERAGIEESINYLTAAIGHYQQIIQNHKQLSLKDRIAVSERIAALYFQKKNVAKMVSVYQNLYPLLKNTDKKAQIASIIASSYQTLKQPQKARRWWEKVDQGGTSDEELQATYTLIEMDLRSQQKTKALKKLKRLAQRKIPSNSRWFLMTHYQLAQLLVAKEQWREAKKHYDQVAASKAPQAYQSYKDSAQKASSDLEEYIKSLGD